VSEILAPVRRCSRCTERLPLGAFRRDSRGFVRSHCNLCALAVTQEWRAHHRAALLARRRAAYAVGVGVPTRDNHALEDRAYPFCAHGRVSPRRGANCHIPGPSDVPLGPSWAAVRCRDG
jgi:hypothetical protein